MMTEREQTLNDVTVALPLLQRIDELYHEAAELQEPISCMQAELDERKAKKSRRVLLSIFTGYIGVIVVNQLPIPIYGGLRGILWIAFGVLFYQYAKKRLVQQQQKIDAKRQSIMPRIDEISKEVYDISTNNAEAIDKLPRDYRYYNAVSHFEHTLANGQADSMKEAISLYEEFLHRCRLEADSARIIQENMRQTEMLESINKSSKSTAINSGVAATFSILSFCAAVTRD